jgi:hypothetical protein
VDKGDKMIIRGSIIMCEELSDHGKPVVAVIGWIHDWAAYEQAYPDQTLPELIADRGDKISQEEARKLFPELENYKYRR